MNPRIPLSAGLLLPLLLLVFSCSDARYFKRASRKVAKGKTERAEKMYVKKLKDPDYDLAAAFFLAKMKTKKYRKLNELVRADSTFKDLALRYEGISKPKAAKLKRVKAAQKSVLSAQARIQRKAIRMASSANNIQMLDTVQGAFPVFLPKVQEEWKRIETSIVLQNLKTNDYDIATSILNRHISAVPEKNIGDLYVLRDKIWQYFNHKYSLCKIDKFRRDHPRERLSRDCWFEQARDMFCTESLDSALAFHQRYPYSGFEIEIMNHILHKTKHNSALDYPGEKGEHIGDIKSYQTLINTTACGYLDSVGLWRDLSHYLRKYAPRYSAFVMLQSAVGYYSKNNQHDLALALLEELQPRFPDTIACEATHFYRLDEQTLFSKHLSCFRNNTSDLNLKAIIRWDKERTKEYDAVSWDEGYEVYFAQQAGKKTTVMRSVFDNGEWSVPTPVPPLSIANKATPMSMTQDGLQILLKVGSRLYVSERSDELASWSTPRKIPLYFPKMKRAVFAPDGSAILLDAQYDPPNRLYRPSSNLYYCEITPEGKYKKPRSMGNVLNTEDNEIHPYLCQDGKTLLFCSNGHDGYGGLDVYKSTRSGTSWSDWSRPVNLGCLENSVWDERGFSWVPENGKQALFTAYNKCDKNRTVFQEDLPEHVRPYAPLRLRGRVRNAKGDPVSRGEVQVWVDGDKEARITSLSQTGRYTFAMKHGDSTARLKLHIAGYFSPDAIEHALTGRAEGEVILDSFRVWSVADMRKGYVLQHVQFEGREAILTAEKARSELLALTRFALPLNAKLHIEGHCAAGTPDAQALSELKARTVRDALEKLGIASDRLTATGKGDTEKAPTPKSPYASSIPQERVVVKVELSPEMLKKMEATRRTAGNAGAQAGKMAPKETKKTDPAKSKARTKPIVVETPTTPKKKKWWRKMMFWKKNEARMIALEADKQEKEAEKKGHEAIEGADTDEDEENE